MKDDGQLMIQVRKRAWWETEWTSWYDPQNWIADYTDETVFDLLAKLRHFYCGDPCTEFRVVRVRLEPVEPPVEPPPDSREDWYLGWRALIGSTVWPEPFASRDEAMIAARIVKRFGAVGITVGRHGIPEPVESPPDSREEV